MSETIDLRREIEKRVLKHMPEYGMSKARLITEEIWQLLDLGSEYSITEILHESYPESRIKQIRVEDILL